MICKTVVLAAGLALTLSSVSSADIYVDDFEGGANDSEWAFIRGGDVIEPAGGNPDSYLHQPAYDTFAPILKSLPGTGTPFSGNYAAAGVSRISWDAITANMNFPDGTGYNIALVLRDDKGTANVDDDDFVYSLNGNIPRVGEGWIHYDVAIDSQATDLPAGWLGGWVGDCSGLRPGVTYADVISNVSAVEIWWLDPCYAAIFQQWDVGADNLEIEFDGATPTIETSWGQIKTVLGNE